MVYKNSHKIPKSKKKATKQLNKILNSTVPREHENTRLLKQNAKIKHFLHFKLSFHLKEELSSLIRCIIERRLITINPQSSELFRTFLTHIKPNKSQKLSTSQNPKQNMRQDWHLKNVNQLCSVFVTLRSLLENCRSRPTVLLKIPSIRTPK